MTTLPGRTPSTTPAAPRITVRMSAGPGTQTHTTSQCAATSRGESAQTAPRSSSGAAAAGRRSWTTRGNPAWRTKPAIGAPMLPRPMNPTRIAVAPPLSCRARLLWQEPVRASDHHRHEHHADENLLRGGEPHPRQERNHVLGEPAPLEQAEEHQRAEERPAVVTAPTEDEREPDVETLLRQEHVGLHVRQIVRKQNAGEPRHAGAEREGLHLEAEDRLAGDRRHHLVLANRAKHATERRAAQALERGIDEPDRGQHEEQVEERIVTAEPRVERT